MKNLIKAILKLPLALIPTSLLLKIVKCLIT